MAAVGPVVRLRLGSEQAAVLPYHIPMLAETVREIASRHDLAQLIIDLTELAPGPFYQELACLCGVLRRILGPGIPIVLADANPAVAWSLESGYLPENVIVAPIRRHRRRAGFRQVIWPHRSSRMLAPVVSEHVWLGLVAD